MKTDVTEQFNVYAAFYDLLYKDKDYKGEAAYIDSLLQEFVRKDRGNVKLLDLACGTGKHLMQLSRLGYSKLNGSDISASMIDVARSAVSKNGMDIEFFNHSFQEANQINRKYDVVISMFSAVNYLTNYEDQRSTLQNVHGLLEHGGMFIFDYWNGNAVTTQFSPLKVLRKKNGNTEIMRISETSIDQITQDAIVKFTCLYFEDDKKVSEFQETHHLHYYYFPEIKNLLAANGFELVHISPFMKMHAPISAAEWNISIVAKKI